jgi:glycosyltransferase involved in cell wall biosynthesis
MKVLWLRPSTGHNVSVRRERIAEHLRERGVNVTIRDASGINVFTAIKNAAFGDYDLIIGNVRIGLYIGYVLSRILRNPLFGDVSDSIEDMNHLPTPIYKSLRALEWWILGRVSTCFFVESESFEAAEKRGLDPILVKNSVDFYRFNEPTDHSKQKARTILLNHDIFLDRPIATYIGSMVPHYHLSAVGAAAKVTPEWQFVFIGEERGAGIEDVVSGLKNAHFLGAYEYELMPGFLTYSDAGICLADREQPLKIMEYGAAGLPTLGYSGKLRRNFSDEELLFVDPNPSEISEALQWISANPEGASEYGRNLQRKARENSWEAVAQKYYDQIIKITKQ